MDNLPDPSILIVFAGVMSLVPFLVVMGTSFVKMMIVFSLVRNALGIQSIPPNIALNGIALILTLYVMAPVVSETIEVLQGHRISLNNPASIISVGSSAVVPYRQFLLKHVDDDQVDFFIETAEELWGERYEHELTRDNLFILIPAFVVGQLTSAFEIGFLIYLPFIVVDLVISNILLAMGMMMLSPVTISLPFKLLLFVFLDGWEMLIQGLILSYK